MSPDGEPTLLGREYLDITEYRDVDQVVALLREANSHYTRIVAEQQGDGGLVWNFRAGPVVEGGKILRIGVRGDRGSVEWFHGQEDLIPADGGLNDDWVDYWSWHGHESGAPPGSELPIDQVYQLLAEFVRTADRPNSIAWQQPEEE